MVHPRVRHNQSETGLARRLVVGALVLAAALSAAPVAAASVGDVSNWGYTLSGSRYNAAEHTITAANVHRLKLKWAFAVPTATGAQSQPAIVDGTMYFGGTNGVFYALNATTGKLKWRFNTNPVVHTTGLGNALRDGPAVANGVVYFGDKHADMFALSAATGKLLWMTKLSQHPAAVMTGSPTVYQGKVIVGVSSTEELSALSPTYPCCTFRGSLVALDASTGALIWQWYTLPQAPALTGYSVAVPPVPQYGPSGVAVWSTPAIDPNTGTVFIGTGNQYTGETPTEDSMVALDVNTGTVKWLTQLSNDDTWNFSCVPDPFVANCPQPGSDYDFGASPNVFQLDGRTVVGEGQKSSVYHLLDATTGAIIWQTLLNVHITKAAQAAGLEGIEWGTSYDGKRIYASTNIGAPGTLFALNPATGKMIWRAPVPLSGCAGKPPVSCLPALPSAVTSTPGIVWEGSQDGILQAYSSATGKVLWSYDTVRKYRHTTDGIPGFGGSIDGGGTVVSHGMVYSNSGYTHFGIVGSEMTGNVVLAFSLPPKR